MRAVGLDGEPELVRVEGSVDVVRWRFCGSPTVTVDGRDVHAPLSVDGELPLGMG